MLIPGLDELLFGEVVSYNVNSGYGFIRPAEDSAFTYDVYFNNKELLELPDEVLQKNFVGVACGFNLRLTQDGRPQAKRVELVSKPEAAMPPEEPAEPTGQVLRGIIKAFKQSNGYGFVYCRDLGRDVWFARRELPADLMQRHLPGAEVFFDLWVTADEKPQARALRPTGAPGLAGALGMVVPPPPPPPAVALAALQAQEGQNGPSSFADESESTLKRLAEEMLDGPPAKRLATGADPTSEFVSTEPALEEPGPAALAPLPDPESGPPATEGAPPADVSVMPSAGVEAAVAEVAEESAAMPRP